ncbi:patatin [Leptospira fletcheri]|uniref:patatin n=1 Tax=Leptospira fletcheri TaxID=2484981 RepID=UPI001AEFF8E1|nr:patatin [Leptospira fletcheri]
MFTPRTRWNPGNWLRAKYDRNPFIEQIKNTTTSAGLPLESLSMKDVKTHFMATSFNLCSKRTHFLKSWEDYDGGMKLWEVISWSALSAAYYFGKINVPDYQWTAYLPDGTKKAGKGGVFQDGGQGVNNNTIHFILSEIAAKNWWKEGTFLLSLGTGNLDISVPYETASKENFMEQIVDYPFEARTESTIGQVLAAKYIAGVNDSFKFKRFDILLQEKENELDNVQYIDRFVNYGKVMAESLDSRFVADYF